MRENKLHISNKSFVTIKLSLLAAVLIGLVLFIASVVNIFAVGPSATIWTTDSNGELKIEFVHDDTIYISGEGFTQSSNVNIKVFEPDATERCSGNVTTDSLGAFDYTQFSCKLNGKDGIYTVTAIDTQGITAEYQFSEPTVTYTVESYSDNTYTTVKNNFIQGETVYGKATRSSAANMRLRYRNPSNTVVKTCTPSDSSVVYCDYTLPSDAPVGEWDIQIGRCDYYCGNINNWDWTHGTDHFNVAATPTNPEICNDQMDNDGDGYTDCADSDCKPCLTIVADKIICNSEDDLPNLSGTSTYIDTNTAQNYVNAHSNDCGLASDWYFQWIFGGTNPGDNLEYATGWNTFGPTNANGRTSVVISKADSSLWFREALKPGYLQFSGVGGSDVTAEFYCDGDVLNYDNYDNLNGQPITDGDTFYCVAFNVKSCTSDADCSSLNTACAEGVCNAQNLCEQRLKPAQTECRAAAGMCDVTEVCDGQSATCPADSFQSNSFLCRPASDVCDAEEYCTGSSAYCPPDDVQPPATKVCRPAAGVCDVADYCDGKNLYCPTDVFKSSTEVCRASAGECDLTEYCTGSSADCPDVDEKSTALCRQAAGQCDVDEYCDGKNDVCPADTKAPSSTTCNDGLWCSETDHCDDSGNCVKLTDRDCSANNTCGVATCDNNPDDYHPTWDFRDAFTSVCDENTDSCTQGDTTITHTCDKTQCGAECDAQNPCNNKCVSNVFYSNGQCGDNCTCYYSQQNCDDQITCTVDSCDPVTGCSNTPDNSLCDDKDPCTIDVCDVNRDVNRGCVNTFSDTTGPVTSDVIVDPYYNNGNFNATALANDTCSNIKKSEYFVGHGLGSCGFAGTGTSMDATDGGFDELVEDIKKDNIQYFFDGLNYICIQSQDVANNWGNCECAYYETDIIPPDCPTDIYMDNQLYPNEYLICGNNAWLNASVCDQESKIQGGEYFIDKTIPPIPAPWSGYWMNTLYNFTRQDSWKCGIIGALVDTSNLADGTHYIKIRGKDTAENWGKISECRVVSFIKDTTAPVTTKQLNPTNGDKVDCDITNMNGQTITDGCYYVKQGTTVTLTAIDPDPQGTGEHADNVLIHYKIYWSYDGSSWTLDTEEQSVINQPITLNLTKDSYHLIEYWAMDGCNWEETHHFELDIVDTVSPVTTKNIIGPQFYNATEDKFYIDGKTEIELTCVDPQPHPVDNVTIYYRYRVDDGTWKEWTEYTGKFKFPEESKHELEYYCVDALGNEECHKFEIDYVDHTPPITTKIYGIPYYINNVSEWVTSQTPVILNATDGTEIHASGVKETKYRVTQVDDVHCQDSEGNYCYYAQEDASGEWGVYTAPFTINEESCHLIEYYSVDNVEKTETKKFQCVYVENTPPVSSKSVGDPKKEVDCTTLGEGTFTDGCYFITQNTPINLTCTDLGDHPVNQVKIKYKIDWKNESVDSWTEGTWTEDSNFVTFNYNEDSYHRISWYCFDALGNTEQTHTELDIVDTQAPVSNKTVGEPKHACTQAEVSQYYTVPTMPSDGCYFINQSTPITLTCADQSPHPVDHEKIYYRYFSSDLSLSGHCVGTPDPFWCEIFPPCNCEDHGYNDCVEVGCHWELINFTEVLDDEVTIYPGEDSAHVLQWYCADELGNTESLHEEYDIVDTEAPSIVKFIVGPSYGDCLPTETDDQCFIDGVTKIHVESRDPSWHPSDHVTCDWDYTVTDGTKIGTGQIGVVPPFDINFPEESTHVLTITCKDILGNEETDVEKFIVDKTPPTTTKTYGTPLVEAVTGGYPKWITSQTPITLTVDDTGIHKSGIKETKYRVTLLGSNDPCESDSVCQQQTGSGDWNAYTTTPFTIGQESCHLIEYYSVDNVNKTEVVKKQCVYVDNTPPEISKEVGTPKVESIEMTEYKPQESYDVKDRAWFVNQSTLINLTCVDPLPHPVNQVEIYYKYYNDGQLVQNWTLYTTPFTYGEDTYHELYYYCEDALGNRGPTHYQLDIVDTQAPVSQKTFDGLNIPCSELKCANESSCDNYITQNTKINLTCSDLDPHPVNDVKVFYRYFVDDNSTPHQDWTEYTESIKYDEDSKHTLEWYCVDKLGNQETTHTEVERVDTAAPNTTKTVGDPKWGENDYWVTSNTPITLITVDKEYPCASGHTTLYFEDWYDSNCDNVVDSLVNNGTVYTNQDCKLETTIYLNGECLHTLKWYAVDELGNTEEMHIQDHKVDNTPPHVLILKPVDGWYSEGEDISIVAVAEDLDGKNSPCGHDCDPLGKDCAVGIEDGTQCYAYLLDILPESRIVQLNAEGTFMYNADAKECQGYATIPEGSEIPDGVTILVVRAKDNLGNEAGSLAEILRAVFERCGCDVYDMCAPKCVADVMQDVVTIWNLPKIGIDNHAPEVNITTPEEGTLFGGEQVYFSADVIDSNDGDVTSTITTGTPCYITIGGISLGTVPYNNVERKCSGTIMIPQDTDFPQGTQELKVDIADNAGNLGSDIVNVNVDTVVPTLSIIIPTNNQFVKGTLQVTAQVDDANLDASSIKISTDNGQTWKDVWYCNPSTYCYDWDTTTETDGMAYGIIARATDLADNTGYSEEVIVIVDNGAPEGVYVLNPIKNDIVQGTITLKALATDYVSGIDNVKIYVSSVVWNCDATLTGGTWQCNLDSTSFPDGVHHVYAVATDNVGKQTTSANVPFIIDNNIPTTPSGLIHIPSGNYVTQNSVTWKWQVSSDSGSGLDHYIIDIDGIGYTVSTSPESGYESYTINLLEGAHTAKVKVFDKAGHASEWSNTDSLTIDTISPSTLTIYGTNIENPIYDTNGNYGINWNGGIDTNFDRYELYEDGTLAYTGSSNVLSRSLMSEGSHEYQVKTYDKAGHETVSSFFDVFVDTVTPIITENSQSSWGPIGWWFDYSIDDGVKSSGLLTPTYSGGLNLCSFNTDTKTGSCLVFGNANITIHVEDKAGHSTQLTVEKGSEIKTDFTPPELLSSGPSGVINYNKINLTATTNEPSVCKYGIDDDYSTMIEMSGSGTTSHYTDLGTLTDGLKVYHVMCEDMAGNKMDSSKTIVFYIDTSGSYSLSIPDYGHYWSTGWNTFFLPMKMLDDICQDGGVYPVEDILSSLYNGGGANFKVVWYFDGTNWVYFDPAHPEFSTLTVFNDQQSLPYYIKMNAEDRLEITTANCGLD